MMLIFILIINYDLGELLFYRRKGHLLQGGGDVGESGSVRVHEVLTQLDKEKEELFKDRGSKHLLNQTINTYKQACMRIEEASLSAQKWNEHAQDLDDAQQHKNRLQQQH
jgi:uncharacterized protein YhaN